jgi:hypothetical protein
MKNDYLVTITTAAVFVVAALFCLWALLGWLFP